MSVRVMTAVWDITLADSEKIVLLALADCANDEGWCWPGMKSLARKCSKTDRTVQASIKALCAAGHLTRIEVPGKGCRYQVHPRSGFTPEAASPPKPLRAPPKGLRDTPEAASGKSSKNHKEPSGRRASAPATRPDQIDDDQQHATGAAGGKAGKPHVLPSDWHPPAVDDLPATLAGQVRQWPAGAYTQAADNFRDHWSAVDPKPRTAAGHAAAFRNWLGRLHPEMVRAAKAGVTFGAPAKAVTASGGVHCGPPVPVLAKADEDDQSGAIHAGLRHALGEAIWRQWFHPAALLVDGRAITIVSPTRFHSEWIEERFSNQIRKVAAKDALHFTVATSPATGRAPAKEGEPHHG